MSLESRIGKLEAASDNNDAVCQCVASVTIGTTPREKGDTKTYRTEKTCQTCGRLQCVIHFTIALGDNTDELGN